ncbi:hypothetical protein AB0N31_23230 [Streptomyces sp. NPDC051051]|uniref:hypothetical protein n=1 Tax=Streptomyces sp. NPDC051051 TaxID=3155666 RepID=UPI0034342B71
MSPPRVAAADRWLGEAAGVLGLIGTPLQIQELRALQAHLAFHKGRLDDARALSHALLQASTGAPAQGDPGGSRPESGG